jgi:phosphatidylglycerophosphatase A
VPKAPGTAGSLLGVGLFYLIFPEDLGSVAVLLVVSVVVAVWLAGQGQVAFGGTDPSPVVVDEIVGQWFALAFVPRTFWWAAGAFFLFRALDIWKPWRAVERWPGGVGIVADDVVAGIASALCLMVLRIILGA